MNDPAAGYETGDDNIEVVTPANYYCKNGKHYIIYDEVLEGMAGTIRNKIKITGNDSVEIMKSGASSSHMIFEKNRKKFEKGGRHKPSTLSFSRYTTTRTYPFKITYYFQNYFI